MKPGTRSLCALAVSLLPSAALADGTDMLFEPIITGSFNGTFLAPIPGDPSRILMGTSFGNVIVVDIPGRRTITPFLLQVTDASTNGGLNIAFHPQFAQNRTFFYLYQGQSRLHLLRYRLSSTTPYTIEPNSNFEVLTVLGMPGQHTGGICAFGPDGYLYLSIGEGYGDPQSLSSWGGKIMRIDIDGPDNIIGSPDDDDFPNDPNLNYAIPPGNPYINTPNARPETVALGLRNPYRGGFDPASGDLIIADVGEFTYEEINVMPRAVWGLNFGWPRAEGPCSTPACASFTNPAFFYPRSNSYITGRAIIGGLVYTGCTIPWLQGSYIFSDNTTTWITTAHYANGTFTNFRRRDFSELGNTLLSGIAGFAQTDDGNLYITNYSRGVYRLRAANLRDCNANGTPDSCEPRGACMADFNGDCGVTIDDLLAFLSAYSAGRISADLDDGTSQGLVDGAVTIEDLLYFLNHFANGC